MAISGTLDKVSLTDVLSLLKRRVGVLKLSNLNDYRSCEFYVAKDELLGFRSNDQAITDPQLIKKQLTELINTPKGSFEFKEGYFDSDGELQLSIRKLLLEAKFDVIKTKTINDSLADPKTRFCRTDKEINWEDERLHRFYNLIKVPLKTVNGMSAEDVSKQLGIELRNAQIALYKLRILNVIAPVRAHRVFDHYIKFKAPSDLKPTRPISSDKDPSLIRRLIRALRIG